MVAEVLLMFLKFLGASLGATLMVNLQMCINVQLDCTYIGKFLRQRNLLFLQICLQPQNLTSMWKTLCSIFIDDNKMAILANLFAKGTHP